MTQIFPYTLFSLLRCFFDKVFILYFDCTQQGNNCVTPTLKYVERLSNLHSDYILIYTKRKKKRPAHSTILQKLH